MRDGIFSSPWVRAISSTRSAERSRSPRQLGIFQVSRSDEERPRRVRMFPASSSEMLLSMSCSIRPTSSLTDGSSLGRCPAVTVRGEISPPAISRMRAAARAEAGKTC